MEQMKLSPCLSDISYITLYLNQRSKTSKSNINTHQPSNVSDIDIDSSNPTTPRDDESSHEKNPMPGPVMEPVAPQPLCWTPPNSWPNTGAARALFDCLNRKGLRLDSICEHLKLFRWIDCLLYDTCQRVWTSCIKIKRLYRTCLNHPLGAAIQKDPCYFSSMMINKWIQVMSSCSWLSVSHKNYSTCFFHTPRCSMVLEYLPTFTPKMAQM